MKMINNFAGLNGFVWWVGVVENRLDDPLKLGRCQVRIFGWHTPDKTLLPTADLPWAHPIYALNSTKSFTTPREGDYVMGFFFDSESGQFPAMLGVIPGLANGPAQGDSGFQDPRTPDEIASAPQPPAGQTQTVPGEPTTVPLARGEVANSAIQATNTTRDAVQNIQTQVKATFAAAKLEALAFIQAIRAAKDAIIASFTPVGSGPANDVANDAKQAIAQVNAYKQQAQAAIEAAKDVQAAIAEVEATIQYINSLPASTVAQINSEVDGLYSSILSSANSKITSLTSSIKV